MPLDSTGSLMATATLPDRALDVPDDSELIFGRVYPVEPRAPYVSALTGNIVNALGRYCERVRVGRAYHGMMYRLPLPEDPNRVRKPNLSFVSFDRWPEEKPFPYSDNYLDVVPDLMAVVPGPADLFDDAFAKADEYLLAGARLVWVIGPRSQLIHIFEELKSPRILTATNTLDGGNLLPGFAVPVKSLFPPMAAM